jgi:hypothetical protein
MGTILDDMQIYGLEDHGASDVLIKHGEDITTLLRYCADHSLYYEELCTDSEGVYYVVYKSEEHRRLHEKER